MPAAGQRAIAAVAPTPLLEQSSARRPITIRRATVADIMSAPAFPALVAEYAAESAIPDLPQPDAKLASYKAFEHLGFFRAFAALSADDLVGFVTVAAPPLPHYSQPIAVAESFFVASAHRKTGAGLKLLEAAEGAARELGSKVLLVCAPFNGRLFEVLPRRGYTETNRVFCKGVADA